MALTKAHNRMIEGAYVNVLDYGAKGDGSTDDTAAIQAALNAASLGGVVYFPKGEYVVSTLTHTGPAIRLLGSNAGNASNRTFGALYSSTIRFTETTNDAFTFTDAGYFSKNVSFENLGIMANTSGYAIDIQKHGEFRFVDCLIDNRGAGGGVNLNEVYLISFTDCYITKSDNFRASGSQAINIDNNGLGGIFNFFTSTVNGYGLGVNIDALYNDGTQLESFNFIGSQANSNTVGLALSGYLRSGMITGSYFEGNSLASIQMIQGVQNFVISGCFFNDPANTSGNIKLGRGAIANDDNIRNITISNCHISNINQYGIICRADPAFGGNIRIQNCNFDEYSASTNTTFGIVLQTDYVTTVEDCQFDTLDVDFSGAERAKRISSAGVYQNSFIAADTGVDVGLTGDSPSIVTYNPTGADRVVRLPAIADAIGKEFLISCKAGASYSIVVKDSTSTTTYQTLTAGQSCKVWNDGTSQFTYKL